MLSFLKRLLVVAFVLAPASLHAATILSTQTLRVDTRTAMAAIDVVGSDARFADGDFVILEEGNRAGLFRYTAASIQTAVTADTAQCVYVPPASDTDGSSGGYVRVWEGKLQIEWCGAVGDFVLATQVGTDDTAAFASAIAVVKLDNAALNGDAANPIAVPDGNFRITDPLDFDFFGACVVGEGPTVSRLIIDHNDGPGIRFQRSYSCLRDISVSASDARDAGAAGTNYGVLFEPPDTPGTLSAFSAVDNVIIEDHPSHGLLIVTQGVEATQVDVRDNDGHGIAVDPGFLTSRTNKVAAGWLDIVNVRTSGNGGHGVAIGHPSSTSSLFAFRVNIVNLDSSGNASDALVRYKTDDSYLVGEQVKISQSAMSGSDTHGALYMAGRARAIENRLLDVTSPAITIGQIALFPTVEADVSFSQVISPAADLDPAVAVETGAIGVRISAQNSANIDALTATGEIYTEQIFGLQREWVGESILPGVRGQQVTIADDAIATLTLSGDVYGTLFLMANVNAGRAMAAHIRANASAFCTLGWGTVSVDTVCGSPTGTAPTGTTGVDGDLTVTPKNNANVVWIENRTGSARTYNFFWIGGGYIVSVL